MCVMETKGMCLTCHYLHGDSSIFKCPRCESENIVEVEVEECIAGSHCDSERHDHSLGLHLQRI